MNDKPFRLTYIPAFDGLRGIAIGLVVIFHAIPQASNVFTGGFIGVDIFFVLSGFLITSLLIKEWRATGTISLNHFYIRRVLRLAPALLVVLTCLNVFALLAYDTQKVQAVQHDTALALAYLSNWAMAFEEMQSPFLTHTWSLAIEEQFYIVFPVVMALLLKCLHYRTVIGVLSLLTLLSWAWRVFLVEQGVAVLRLYHGTDTHLDGLLMGGVLALILATPVYTRIQQGMMRHTRGASVGAAGVGLFLLHTALTANIASKDTYTVTLTGVNAATCALILFVIARPAHLLTRLLETRPLVYMGKISYALYLWHVVIAHSLGYFFTLPVVNGAIVGTALAFLVAHLSYTYIEQPVLRLKQRYQNRPA